jgi:DNA-binding protein HU-beta
MGGIMAAKRKKSRRTTLYSSKGKKLYAVRTAGGQFKDIQSYKRAHGMDIKRRSKAEIAAKAKTASRKKTTRRRKAKARAR